MAKAKAADRMSCAQIAAYINRTTNSNFSRSAIIGKLHRLGLSSKAPAGRRGPRRNAQRKNNPRPNINTYSHDPQARARALAELEAIRNAPELVIPLHERKTIETLDSGDCKWPIGDPKHDPDFHFCGRPRVSGLPYCKPHVARAYATPPMPRSFLDKLSDALTTTYGPVPAKVTEAA